MSIKLDRLVEAVRQVCPEIVLELTGNIATPSFPSRSTTDQQKQNAAAVIAGFDFSDAADAAWEEDKIPNRKSIKQSAAQAIADNIQAMSDNATFLAIVSPTNAQVLAQVKRLSQECTKLEQQNNAIIKRLIEL